MEKKLVAKLKRTNYHIKYFCGGIIVKYMKTLYTLFNFYANNTRKLRGKLVQDIHTTYNVWIVLRQILVDTINGLT